MIVIVNAFDDPAALNDLNIFSRFFGLPECGDANPCLQVVYAAGTAPPLDALWAANAADITQYAHAFAPGAQIVLVEAASASVDDTNASILFANQYVIDHSPTGTAQMIIPFWNFESPNEIADDAKFTTAGIVYISGNQLGIDIEYPAASPNVIGVGVTGIMCDPNGVFRGEFASNFDTGGKSAYEARPSYQDGISAKVGDNRGVPDVSFIADPIAGAVVYYDSVGLDGFVGWQYSGNVGIAEAIWAAMINTAGKGRPSSAAELTALYGHLGDARVFRDITVGQAFGNRAGPGWDVLSGLGSGITFFAK